MNHRAHLTIWLLLSVLAGCSKEKPESDAPDYYYDRDGETRDFYFTGVLLDSVNDTMNNYFIYLGLGQGPCSGFGELVTDRRFLLQACDVLGGKHPYGFGGRLGYKIGLDTNNFDSTSGFVNVPEGILVRDDTVEYNIIYEPR